MTADSETITTLILLKSEIYLLPNAGWAMELRRSTPPSLPLRIAIHVARATMATAKAMKTTIAIIQAIARTT